MENVGDNKRPIIVKRKKVIVNDHHGGAWKVAYADFVTAMMAFFLLMWLLGATTEKQRKAIADYFNPTITVNRNSGGGGSFFGGDSPFPEDTLPHNGIGATNPLQQETKPSPDGMIPDRPHDNQPELEEAHQILLGTGAESVLSDRAKRHIISTISDEGLVVEIFDLNGVPLFDYGTSNPTEITKELLMTISNVFALSPNQIAVNGHTRTLPIVARVNESWENSMARAMKSRELLRDFGTEIHRIQRVTGYGNQKQVADNPLSLRNNRIEIILLRSDKTLK